jgi:hypothetical protein
MGRGARGHRAAGTPSGGSWTERFYRKEDNQYEKAAAKNSRYNPKDDPTCRYTQEIRAAHDSGGRFWLWAFIAMATSPIWMLIVAGVIALIWNIVF